MTDEAFTLMRYFPKSYIDGNKELVLDENINFSLDRISDRFDLCLKVIQ